MMRPLFTRSAHNPILSPSGNWWEAKGVLNPGAALYEDQTVLVYRAVGADGISRLGIAWSADGETIDRRGANPFYEAAPNDLEARLGVEDPRITLLEGIYLLTYTKVSVEPASQPALGWEPAPFRLRCAVGVTTSFQELQPSGVILPHTNTKDAVLFPRLFDGRYTALIREYPDVQLTTSRDLQRWSTPVPVLAPIPDSWQAERVGAGPPPIETPWGWLLLYHANEYLHSAGNRRFYRMGLAVLDRSNPSRVIYRHPDPVFSPETSYEKSGPVGNVVFATGLIEQGGRLYLYYGAGDGVIGLATAEREDVHAFLRDAMGEASP
ncbi:MAG: glycoside hydrolase family 130 protein [Chloroflexota bacterium]